MSRSLPILTFHNLADDSAVITFPPRLFEWGIAHLHELGYRTMQLQDAVGFLRRGEPFPARSLVITFDDGYRSVFDTAFPILARYRMTATVFLTTGEGLNTQADSRLPPFEGNARLSWAEMRVMQQAGITFGAHTATHPNLTRLSSDRVDMEMRASKEILENALGIGIDAFAYPGGRFNEHTREIAEKYFDCACTDRLGLVHSRSDAHALERVDAYYLRGKSLFGLLPTRYFPSYLLMRAVPRRIRRALIS